MKAARLALMPVVVLALRCGDVKRDLIVDPAGGTSSTGGAENGGATGVGGGACQTTEDCRTGDAALCHPERLRCVECVTDAHCREPERCSRALGECSVPCGMGSVCPNDDPICDLVIGFCVECMSDADCGLRGPCRGSECFDP